ncbi:MAG: glycerophosphodiester phosphodiesterase [Alphaproteobacteria bacterium]|nr:glycerophosphodiester phosphodiesterase [Alphaproteobacteria bacterium]
MTFSFFAKGSGRVHVCGHRGHCIGAPENTLAAFRIAHDLGATSCEIDTVLTRDGEIAVIHDLLVDRTTNGSGAVCDMTLAEVQALDAGSSFSAAFAGERVPALRQAIDLAHDLDMGLEIEIKEKRDLPRYYAALERVLNRPGDLDRIMMISFDHVSLRNAKSRIPGLKTGAIIHERLGDPVAVARSADLDEMCIDLAVFTTEDAQALHDAGISIRCHAYHPEAIAAAERAGLAWTEFLHDALKAGHIDTLSGDDVDWLRRSIESAV